MPQNTTVWESKHLLLCSATDIQCDPGQIIESPRPLGEHCPGSGHFVKRNVIMFYIFEVEEYDVS